MVLCINTPGAARQADTSCRQFLHRNEGLSSVGAQSAQCSAVRQSRIHISFAVFLAYLHADAAAELNSYDTKDITVLLFPNNSCYIFYST